MRLRSRDTGDFVERRRRPRSGEHSSEASSSGMGQLISGVEVSSDVELQAVVSQAASSGYSRFEDGSGESARSPDQSTRGQAPVAESSTACPVSVRSEEEQAWLEQARRRAADLAQGTIPFRQGSASESGTEIPQVDEGAEGYCRCWNMCTRCRRLRSPMVIAGVFVLVVAISAILVASKKIHSGPSGRREETFVLKVAAETTQTTVEDWGRGSAPGSVRLDKDARITSPSHSINTAAQDSMKDDDTPPRAVVLPMDSFVCAVEGARLVCYSMIRKQCVVLGDGRDERPRRVTARKGGSSRLPVCAKFEILSEV